MTAYQLAQLNIGRLTAPLDSPQLAGFVERLEDINALAEAAPGFVWRFQTEDGDATAVRPYDDDRILVNFSVWESAEALHAYVYRSAHADVMRQRKAWFERMEEAYLVLWWVPRGHRPTISEATARLAHLRANGPTGVAFTYRSLFPAPDAAGSQQVPLLPDPNDSVVDALERAPGVVVPLVREVPPSLLKRRPKAGKWSAHEHACHLAVVHGLFFSRLDQMLASPAPVITPYDPGTDDPDDALLGMDLNQSLDRYVSDRVRLVQRLRTLSPSEWSRTAEHGEYSHYSIFIMFRHLALHDFFHAYRIEELLLKREW